MADSSETDMSSSVVKVGILTVSDSCYNGTADDKSGANLAQLVGDGKLLPDAVVSKRGLVPDEKDKIQGTLTEWADAGDVDVILTTGGTGFAPRDVTPEATKEILDKEAPGLTYAMISNSLKITHLAMLSRPMSGIRKKTVIVNLPGSKKGSKECFEFVAPALTHAVDLLQDRKKKVSTTHAHLQGGGHQCPHDRQHQHHDKTGEEDKFSVLSHSRHQTKRAATAISESQLHQISGRVAAGVQSTFLPKNFRRSGEIIILQHKHRQKRAEMIEQETSQPMDVSEVINVQETSPSVQDNPHFPDTSDVHKASESLDGISSPIIEVTSPEVEEDDSQEETVPHVVESDPVCDLTTGESHDIDIHQAELTSHMDMTSEPSSETTTTTLIPPKIYKRNKGGPAEIHYVSTGKDLKVFLANHPLLKGLYLNRGKRGIKRHLVTVRRDESAVDCISYKRGQSVLERNRFDDHFELTEKGGEKLSSKCVRDEYVVNWYTWCPGHGNCLRKCGGYGACVRGCKGMAHKQDRHNCSVLVNLKVFLSNPTQWRVHISGDHVPPGSGLQWHPPQNQRIDEDLHDLIINCSPSLSTSQLTDMLSKKQTQSGATASTSVTATTPQISKKRITGYVAGMKKRRNTRDHNVKPQYKKSVKDGDLEASSSGAQFDHIQIVEGAACGVDSSSADATTDDAVIHCIVPDHVAQIQTDPHQQEEMIVVNAENLTLYKMLQSGQVNEIVVPQMNLSSSEQQQLIDCVETEQELNSGGSVESQAMVDTSAVTDFDALLMVASQQQHQ